VGGARTLRTVAVAAILVGAALTIPTRHLWDPDESRYAEVTREMLASRQMLVPLLYGEPYPHKPPLYFWAEGALRACGVPWTPAAVLPSLLALLGVLLVLPRLAVRLGMERDAGILAGALLATSPLAAALGLGGRMDMLLALFHTLALLNLARLLGVGGGAPAGSRAHLWFWTCIAAGVLTKGPVAIALPLLVVAGMWLATGRRVAWRPVVAGWGPVLAVGIVLAWIVPAGLAGGREYLLDIVVRQTADRVTSNPYAHPQPFYFHLVSYPFTGVPWSPVILLAAWTALRRRGREAATFLAIAVVATLLLFSAVSGKLVIYLLPLFPPAALLAADALLRELRGTRTAVAAGGALMALVGVGFAVSPQFRTEMASDPILVALGGAALAVPALTALVMAIRGRSAPMRWTAAVVLSGAAFAAVTLPVATRVLDPFMTVYGVARTVADLESGQDTGLVYQDRYPGLSLYADRPFAVLSTPAALRYALASGRWVVIEEKDLRRIPPEERPPVIETRRILHRRRVILLVRGDRPG
jgi:4-amino-4-deoxy-L-arabinose transferase-like glycosyltransferase